MEKFNLEKYLANPSRKVVTRDGREARIICTDMKNKYYPIVALIENKSEEIENALYYTEGGKLYSNDSSNADLFFAPEKHEGFINIFRERSGYTYTDSYIYKSREDAKEACITNNYLTTTKIEWEK